MIDTSSRGRRSYALTDKALKALEDGKEFVGINKDKLLSLCVEFSFENKENFAEYIKMRMLEHFKKSEKKD